MRRRQNVLRQKLTNYNLTSWPCRSALGHSRSALNFVASLLWLSAQLFYLFWGFCSLHLPFHHPSHRTGQEHPDARAIEKKTILTTTENQETAKCPAWIEAICNREVTWWLWKLRLMMDKSWNFELRKTSCATSVYFGHRFCCQTWALENRDAGTGQSQFSFFLLQNPWRICILPKSASFIFEWFACQRLRSLCPIDLPTDVIRPFLVWDLILVYDTSAKDKSANDTSAKPTVRMPTVRKGQQCEWDKSAYVKSKCANASKCDIGAEKVRQQCEWQQCEKDTVSWHACTAFKPEFWDRQSHFSPLIYSLPWP